MTTIAGISSKPEWNGQLAEVRGFSATRARYLVALQLEAPGPKLEAWLKPGNLLRSSEFDDQHEGETGAEAADESTVLPMAFLLLQRGEHSRAERLLQTELRRTEPCSSHTIRISNLLANTQYALGKVIHKPQQLF